MSQSDKQLVMVCRSGPAFSVGEIQKAHNELDLAGAPRRDAQGDVLSLPARISWLHGRLVSARMALTARRWGHK